MGREWEDACGQKNWAEGAIASRAKHDLVSCLKLNKCFFFLWELKRSESFVLKPACAKSWQVILEQVGRAFAFIGL